MSPLTQNDEKRDAALEHVSALRSYGGGGGCGGGGTLVQVEIEAVLEQRCSATCRAHSRPQPPTD